MWPRATTGYDILLRRGRPHAIDVPYSVSCPDSHAVSYPLASGEKAMACGHPHWIGTRPCGTPDPGDTFLFWVSLRPVFKSSIWENALRPWELWTFKGRRENKQRFWDLWPSIWNVANWNYENRPYTPDSHGSKNPDIWNFEPSRSYFWGVRFSQMNEMLVEYGWKSHRILLWSKQTITSLNVLAYEWTAEGYGFIEFDIFPTVLFQQSSANLSMKGGLEFLDAKMNTRILATRNGRAWDST